MNDAVPHGRSPERPSAESSAHWRAQEMLLMQRVMAQLGDGLQLDGALREMLHLMSELLGLNRGRIVLGDDDGQTWRIRHAYGLTREEVERGCYRSGEGITGRVLAHRHLIIVQDIDREPAFLARAVERSRLPQEAVSFIAMPIQVGPDKFGVLACHRLRNRPRPLSDDVTMLRTLATLAGRLLQLQAALAERTSALERHNAMLARALESATPRYGIVGTSPVLLRAIAQLEQVAPSAVAVLLLGESGTGKELFARALHLASPRRDRPFIKVNCAAVPESLFESELFGHERGAFTGATEARAGWFEQANGGTIFLDEIGDMPLALQAKLLRTLQEGTLTRIGGRREQKVDVRVVAATNRNLSKDIAQGRFREDLFYRLNVVPIRLPALDERRGDIPLLVSQFLSRANQDNQRNVNLTQAAVERLAERPWPGNIRELANVVARIVLLADKAILDSDDIGAYLSVDTGQPERAPAASLAVAAAPVPPPLRPYASASSHSTDQLLQALAACGGNKSRAAQMLGLTTRQFSYRLDKSGAR